MLIYILLVITIIVSCLTCIITVMLEKNELQMNSSEEQTKTSINLLSKTVDFTKTIEILDLYDDSSSEEYSQEPVIIAVLDEDIQATK